MIGCLILRIIEGRWDGCCMVQDSVVVWLGWLVVFLVVVFWVAHHFQFACASWRVTGGLGGPCGCLLSGSSFAGPKRSGCRIPYQVRIQCNIVSWQSLLENVFASWSWSKKSVNWSLPFQLQWSLPETTSKVCF